MSIVTSRINRKALRVGLAACAIAVLAAAGTWRSMAAATKNAQPRNPSAMDVPTHALAGRASYADVVAQVAPAVVTVRVEGHAEVSSASLPDDNWLRRFFGDQFNDDARTPRAFRQRGLGSGVVVSPDGYILTNHHVVRSADDIRVDLSDGRSVEARVVGSDGPSDVAVLKIETANLHALPLGDSDAVRVGDVVLAVGNPLGIGQTVTMGIVSAKGRSTGLGDGSYEDFLQTDAPINEGNSGGALVNLDGELIGINSQIVSPSGGNIGIGFAIPSNMASHVMTLLRTEGRVRRAQLGITVQPVTSDLAASLGLKDVAGAIVSAVAPDSAADGAGLKQGDVVLSLNDEPVSDANALRNRVAEATPGSRATVVVIRDGRQRELTATLGEAIPNEPLRDVTGADADRKSVV